MIDVSRHVASLLASSAEDWAVAAELLEKGRPRHALFFAHLAMEKVLKARVARALADIPPRIHNLVRLAEIAQLELTPEQRDILAELNPFNLAGRYPDTLATPPAPAEARVLMARALEVRTWLLTRS